MKEKKKKRVLARINAKDLFEQVQKEQKNNEFLFQIIVLMFSVIATMLPLLYYAHLGAQAPYWYAQGTLAYCSVCGMAALYLIIKKYVIRGD